MSMYCHIICPLLFVLASVISYLVAAFKLVSVQECTQIVVVILFVLHHVSIASPASCSLFSVFVVSVLFVSVQTQT